MIIAAFVFQGCPTLTMMLTVPYIFSLKLSSMIEILHYFC